MAVSLSVEEQAVCAREVETLYPMLGQLAIMAGMTLGLISESAPQYEFLLTVASFENKHFNQQDMYLYNNKGMLVWTNFGQAVFEEVREIHDHDTQRT